MSDEQTVPTVRDRAVGAGISEAKLLAYVEGGQLLLDGDVVCELDQPAPPGTRILVAGG
ncbi:hypothetical protein PSU4_40150 [Pseudonocardia sulfidoxydans NBRC 16205]|uniref:RNA-binding S4 domain-containing protein n=1 Tax=Pseudonocardia sulfidoxydans NBRC 16205 TaxID=1223511 RepID=A0A511DJT2_9PSEU|nr:hypothetical protein [Pseudonocardia sulfidoxydans]GEL25061.1 hypothetical protein PSU4_40150 [Pseudonocardia sulfidoxydans NBRC 16205]